MKAIDLFAGFGGLTLGAEQAGARVVWAANHWQTAVDVHRLNHPHVEHSCQDLHQADWSSLPDYELMLAAPACQGHSNASQPRRRLYHDSLRATAWAVVACAEVTEPRALIVENVLQFERWRLYPEWLTALRKLGYVLSVHRVRASEYGVPQRRDRLFIIGCRNGRNVKLPGPSEDEPGFDRCLDLGADGWRPLALAKPGARARMERALRIQGTTCLVQHVTGHPGVPLDEPIRTITTKDQWCLVDETGIYRWLTMREVARGMGLPDEFKWPDGLSRSVVTKGLGNAVCPPVAKMLVEAVGNAT